MNVYVVCVLDILLKGKIYKGCIPRHILISNECIYACLVNRNQLLGDAVLAILLVIARY